VHPFGLVGTRFSETLESLLHEKHAHQIASRRRTNDAVDQPGGGQRIAPVFLPDIDDGVRRRIVLDARAPGDLLSRGARNQRLERTIEQPLQHGRTPTRLIGDYQQGSSVVHHPGRHAVVCQTEALGALGIEGFAGEHHIQRRLRANPLGQTQHASPARNDAQHHLGQAQPRRWLVDDQQIAARQRQFETATQAMAAHQRQRRIADCCQAIEELPAALNQRDAFCGRVELGELLNVRTGDKACRLSGTENQPFRWLAVEASENRCQFVHHLAGQ
jgi:hypothetical protein